MKNGTNQCLPFRKRACACSPPCLCPVGSSRDGGPKFRIRDENVDYRIPESAKPFSHEGFGKIIARNAGCELRMPIERPGRCLRFGCLTTEMSCPKTTTVPKTGRKFLAGALVFALLASLLFALGAEANPSIHHWLHKDADGANHSCFVTLLADGKVSTSGSIAALVIIAGVVLRISLPAVEAPLSRFVWRASLPRGPPLSLS